MKKLLLAIPLFFISLGAFASDYTLGDLGINAPWVQANNSANSPSSGFVTIINNGDINDVLESVSTPRAGRVELVNKDGNPTSQIYIGGSQMVDMTVTGSHFVLSDLSSPLQLGEQFPLTLNFQNSGSITVQAEVRENDVHRMNTTIMRNNERHNGKLK